MDLSTRTETFGADDQSWLGSAHGTDMGQTITLDVSTFTAGTHYPNGYFPSGLPLAKLSGSTMYGPYAGSASEVQTVTITGTPTGGTFTLTFDGATTAGIAFNATAAAVKTALEALATVNVGDVTVTGGPGPGTPYSVTFGGQYVGQNVPAMTASAASLTGGTSPAVNIATGTAGGSAASDGTETFVGHLLTPVQAPAVNTTDVSGALFDHGRVRENRLPLPIDAAAKAAVAGRIRYV